MCILDGREHGQASILGGLSMFPAGHGGSSEKPGWYNSGPYESRNDLSKNEDMPDVRHSLERKRDALPGMRY